MVNEIPTEDEPFLWSQLKDAVPPPDVEARLLERLSNFHPEQVTTGLPHHSANRKTLSKATICAIAASFVIAIYIIPSMTRKSETAGTNSSNGTNTSKSIAEERINSSKEEPWSEGESQSRNQLLIASYNSTVKTPQQLANGDLEELANENAPIGWHFRATSDHFHMKLIQDFKEQNHFVQIECAKKQSSYHFGNLMQTIDAKPFLGQRIVFSAKVRGRDLGKYGSVHLWLRIDGVNRKGELAPLTFDNMSDRPVRDPEWVVCRIVSDVPANATHINVGAFLRRNGIAEIDDFSLIQVEEDVPITAPRIDRNEAASTLKPRFVFTNSSLVQEPEPPPKPILANGDFESSTDKEPTQGWNFFPGGAEAQLETSEVRNGSNALRISCETKRDESLFSNLSQSFAAEPWQNKTIRFRAAVKLLEKSPGRVQLWLRGDAKSVSGAPQVVVFDNMQDRPIRSTSWKHFEIVAKIPANTKSLIVGVLFLGEGTMWVDDCSLETIAEGASNITTTKLSPSMLAMSQGNNRPEEPLWLIAFGVILAIVGLSLSILAHQSPTFRVQPFALRFAWVYWVLYSQASILTIFPIVGVPVVAGLDVAQDSVVRWFARNVLRIDHELVGPNGSGDTTHDYIRILLVLIASLLIGAVWTAIQRKRDWDKRFKDLLQSFLRYTLALSLLGYGLAKMTTTMNQFPPPQVEQLLKTWGDSSPMNLIWTMMGSSPSYTFFAGAAELFAAVLLIWRRTEWLGAAMSIGVMLNVFMLNMCYDIPVKQYSFHLLAIGIQLLFADLRWIHLMLLNRPTQPRDLGPSYQSKYLVWIHVAFKIIIILLGFVLPILLTAKQEIAARWSTVEAKSVTNQIIGAYRVETFEVEGGQSSGDNGVLKWQNVSLRSIPSVGERAGYTRMLIYHARSEASSTGASNNESANVEIDLSTSTIKVLNEESALHYEVSGEKVDLNGNWKGKQVHAVLRRISRDDFLLINRGFRWINEVPFNR